MKQKQNKRKKKRYRYGNILKIKRRYTYFFNKKLSNGLSITSSLVFLNFGT